MKLLIVDDNPINQKFLSYSLNKYFEIETALNGLEAINMLNNHDYDVVLMDLSMPVMDGAEATRRIRQSLLFRNRHIPIIFVTTNDIDEERKRCMEIGGDDYFIKPVRIKELKTSIDYYLRQKLDLTFQD
ncbi:MAG: response regulator [Bacteroidota bacterium]|nr:response regulator [Bacteroidota bacterium]